MSSEDAAIAPADATEVAAQAAAAMAATVDAVQPPPPAAAAHAHAHGHHDNRWSKNGFGQSCPAQSTGKFSKEESEQVRRAIEEYCKAKNIAPARLCSECDHKTELKGAWMEIARALPHRTVQSVYRHGLRQLHPFKRGAWSEEEVQLLLQNVDKYGKKWAAIQANLNRSADSCRDKYREICNDFVKGRWKDNETEILKGLIRDHLKANPDADMTELAKMVEQEGITLPWSAISKKMGNRSRLSCFKKWQKMTGQGEKPKVSAAAAAAGGEGGGGEVEGKAKAAGSVPPLAGDADLTPNPIGGEEAEEQEAAAAQIAAETVEAVDLPVLEGGEGGGGGGRATTRGSRKQPPVTAEV